MSGGIEAAGDAVTGALVGRAVEPAHGEGSVGHDVCLNCGATLQGRHCHECGQAAHVHRTIGSIGHEIAHGVFHFEGKIWRTIPMLAARPGELTRRYVHGERARFVSPLALFLFSVFLMFAVFQGIGGPIRSDDTTVHTDFSTSAAKAMVDEAATIRRLEAQRPLASGAALAAIDAQLAETRSDLAGLREADKLMKGGPLSLDKAGLTVDTGSPELDARIRRALDDPKLLLYKLQSSAYKFAWAIIPLSLPFMWLMFAWHREYRMYDHAVFVTYSLSATMLFLIAMALLAALGLGTGWLLLALPVHFFLQLKGAYRLSAVGALVRTLVLLFAALVVLLLFATMLLALGVLG